MFGKIGNTVYSMYRKHPIAMNSLAGCIVFASGETTVQYSTANKDSEAIDWRRVGNIGALGSVGTYLFIFFLIVIHPSTHL